MLAEDLLGAIALDALGARVPARHMALPVEHEDGVVLRAFDQQSEALLAGVKFRSALADLALQLAAHVAFEPIELAALRHVTEDQDDTGHFAGRVLDGSSGIVDWAPGAVFAH